MLYPSSRMATKTLPPPMASICRNSKLIPNPKFRILKPILLSPSSRISHDFMHIKITLKRQEMRTILVHCCLGSEEESNDGITHHADPRYPMQRHRLISTSYMEEERKQALQSKRDRRENERHGYLVVAIISSLGITSMALFAIYYRFLHRIMDGEIPYLEMLGTFALAAGACVGMEYWARWAHKALWHGPLWRMHKSHHRVREGIFELNDVFAISNALPAISLLSYGVSDEGLLPGLCFGAGLGITLFGVAYMFVHDGLVHRRFPVGALADFPYLQRVAAAHKLHHSERLKGVPYGLFLGPQEIDEIGGQRELDKEIIRRSNGHDV